jgi:hypothetical protein
MPTRYERYGFLDRARAPAPRAQALSSPCSPVPPCAGRARHQPEGGLGCPESAGGGHHRIPERDLGVWRRTLPRAARKTGAENRKAARIPSTSLHISRAEDWEAAAERPIDRGAWEVFAGDHPALSRYDFDSDRAREDNITWIMRDRGVTRERATELHDRRAAQVQAEKVSQEKMAAARPDLLAKHPQQFQFQRFSGGTGLPTFGLERPDGTRLLLQWRQGQVTVLRVSLHVAADATLIAPLARELDAHVYAEDGTRYA